MGVDGNPGGERAECGDGLPGGEEGGDVLPLDADGLAGGGLPADVRAGEDVVEADNDPSQASKPLALVPAIHSVSRFFARLRITFPFR